MLSSQLEIVQQARQFLSAISQPEYVAVLKPHLMGSAGAHMRHVLDHYLALKNGVADGLVNYNKRHRHSEVESLPEIALQAWQEITEWLHEICESAMDMPLHVITETSVEHTEYVQVPSTLARELVFVSSHAVHHFSIMAVIRSLQGQSTDANFGIAPATATYLRQQA